MMFMSSSKISINSIYYILIVLFITSTSSYVVESDDLKTDLSGQQYELNIPSYHDRILRTTKFPRIGRSLSDTEEAATIDDQNVSIEENEESNGDHEFRWLDQRSVFFPRIGKRANRHLLWRNSFSNPYRMLDAQGRYHINAHDNHFSQNRPAPIIDYRSK